MSDGEEEVTELANLAAEVAEDLIPLNAAQEVDSNPEEAEEPEEDTEDPQEKEEKDEETPSEKEELDEEEIEVDLDKEETEVPAPEVGDSHIVKIDGEEVEVTLQELKDNFSGKQGWDKKFSELNTEKESHTKEVEQFKGNANQFQELVTEGKAQEALDFLLETAGLNRNQFVETYVSQLAPTIAEYLELSPEEREQRALKQQVEYYKTQQEQATKSQTEQRDAQELTTKINAVMEKHSMSPEKFEELQKELIGFGVEDLTPEVIGQYHVLVAQQDTALEVLKDLNPDLMKDKSAVDYLLSLQANNPGIAKEELKARAEKAFVYALSERVNKDSKATKPRKKGAAKTTSEEVAKGVLTFEDLENINPLDLLGE